MANVDFTDYASDITPLSKGPALDVLAVVPSDTVMLAETARYIRANTAGTITITVLSGVKRTLNFAAGETRFVVALQVWATGTTAAGIEAGV